MTDQQARDEREGLARALYEDEQSRRHPTTPFRWEMAGIERQEYLRRADAVRGWMAEVGYRKCPEPEITEEMVDQAVAGIQRRLSWAPLHWGTEHLHMESLPHIARAALTSALAAR